MTPAPRYFLMRQRRGGPIVPARLWWCDYEPGEPGNKLDRGRLSLYPRADIAGIEVDPQEIFDRIFEGTDAHGAIAPTHWKYAQSITEAEYRFQLKRLRWAEGDRPHDPMLAPKRAIAPSQLPLPNFDRENAL